MERLAVKTMYAAELLESLVQEAQRLQKLQVKVRRYMKQAQLIVTWRRSQGFCTMIGSAAKSVGGVLFLAAPLHPKLSFTAKAAQKLWKLGSSLKILSAVGSMLREIWQSGCRDVLVDFTKSVAMLTKKMSVLQECINDLEHVQGQVNSNNNQLYSPQKLVNILSEYIPANQINYAIHVINIVSGNHNYSPLFDFSLLSTSMSNNSSLAKVFSEIEGFHFTEFVEQNEAKSLVAIGGFLHISKELLDFLDGFHRVTERDCRFLSECFFKFTEESVSIIKVASLLTGLNKLRISEYNSSPALQNHIISSDCDIPPAICSNSNKNSEENFDENQSSVKLNI